MDRQSTVPALARLSADSRLYEHRPYFDSHYDWDLDDYPLLRQGIAALLKTQPDMEFVAEACDGEEAIAQFRRHRPDVTLMDLQMPNINGTEATSRIRSEFPDAKILNVVDPCP